MAGHVRDRRARSDRGEYIVRVQSSLDDYAMAPPAELSSHGALRNLMVLNVCSTHDEVHRRRSDWAEGDLAEERMATAPSLSHSRPRFPVASVRCHFRDEGLDSLGDLSCQPSVLLVKAVIRIAICHTRLTKSDDRGRDRRRWQRRPRGLLRWVERCPGRGRGGDGEHVVVVPIRLEIDQSHCPRTCRAMPCNLHQARY